MRQRIALLGVLCVALLGLLHADGVPILCYHYFVSDSAAGRGRLTETYDRFERMLKFLSEQGFRSCFPEDFRSGRGARERSVIITFDDGKKDQLHAAELLDRYGFKGLFFVIPSRIAEESQEFLTFRDLQSLAKAGHRIAVHGFDHRSMPQSELEVAASQGEALAILRETLGLSYPLADFAFPMGHYTPSIVQALSKSFQFLHTVNPGYWDGRSVLLPRMLVTNDNGLGFYQSYLTGAAKFDPRLRLVTEEGSMSPTVELECSDTTGYEDLELLAVSPDQGGKLYASYPLGANLSIRGKRLVVNLKGHLERFYASSRTVLSYALVRRRNSEVQYLSSGHLHWVNR